MILFWHVCSGCCYQCTTRSRWHLTLQGMLTSRNRCGMFWLMSRHANDVIFSGATWCCNYDVIAMLLPSTNASDLMLHRDTTKETSGPTRRDKRQVPSVDACLTNACFIRLRNPLLPCVTTCVPAAYR